MGYNVVKTHGSGKSIMNGGFNRKIIDTWSFSITMFEYPEGIPLCLDSSYGWYDHEQYVYHVLILAFMKIRK